MFHRLRGMGRRERYICAALVFVIGVLTGLVGCDAAEGTNAQGIPKKLRIGVVPNISP